MPRRAPPARGRARAARAARSPRGTVKRAARQPVTRARIFATALALLDREGPAALSMRRLGEVLGVEAMSLYHHVPNKAAILDGLFEAVLAELPPAPPATGWREAVTERALALRTALLAHPSVIPLLAVRPAATEAALTHVEATLAALSRSGFTPDASLTLLSSALALVFGHCLAVAPSGDVTSPSYASLDPALFPHVRAAAAALPRHDTRADLVLALASLLEGLEPRLAPRRAARRQR